MRDFLMIFGIMVFIFSIIYFFVDSDLFISEAREFFVSGLVLTVGALCGLLIKYLLERNKKEDR